MVASIRALSSVDTAVKYFYYVEKELESSSGWHRSKAVDALGLKNLTKEDFENILSGKITKDVELGQRTKEGIKHHPGHDLTFSSPKSVSIMGLVAGDARVIECHERAVSKALDYVQRHLVYTRIQTDGNLRLERTDNALIAKFTHVTSRPAKSKIGEEPKKPDPQLHTHCLIANATLCNDGVWRSCVFDSLYDNKMLLGEIYRMELVRELASVGYGVEITRTAKGRFMFEIEHVPKEDIDTFSSRRKDILKEAEKRGVKDAVDMAQVALDTRQSKIDYSREELQKAWDERVKSKSILAELKKAKGSRLIEVGKAELMDLALKYAINHLSNREAVFSEQDLHSSMIERLAEFFGTHDINISRIEDRVKTAIEAGQLLSRYNDNDNLLTTPENLKEERRTIKLMQSMLGKIKPIISKSEVARHILKYNLSSERNLSKGQKEAIMLALTAKDRVVGIQGSAGTLKTTTLDIIKNIAKTKGISILGLAPIKAAVNVLKKHTPAHTLSYFIKKYEKVMNKRCSEQTLKETKASFKNNLIVLDEASLASTLQVKHLLQLGDILQFRVLMMGDHRQLGAISNGKPFYYCQDNGMNTCVMGEIKRQQNEGLLKNVYLAEDAVDKFEREAAGIIEKILKNLGDNVIDISKMESLEGENENKDIAEVAYKTWFSLKDKDPLVIAPSHDLRERINEKIRPHFINGEGTTLNTFIRKDLTPPQMRYAKSYEKGDILRFAKENKSIGIDRGSYFCVKEIARDTLILKQGEKVIKYDLTYQSATDGLELYTSKSIEIASGDRMRWTRNSQEEDFIVNGDSFVIKSIQENKIELETKDGIKLIELSNPDMHHIDYDYTSTVYSVQGRTKDHVLAVADSRLHRSLISQRALYVMLSRAKHGVTIVTDNAANLTTKLSKSTGAKTSAIEQMEKIDNSKDTINISRSKREHFGFDRAEAERERNSHTNEQMQKQIQFRSKYALVSSQQFAKDPNLIRATAQALFGDPTELIKNELVFSTEFKFKSDKYDYWHKNLVTVDLASGEYCRLNNLEDEDDYSGSMYKLAQEHGLFEAEEQQIKQARIQKLFKNSQPIRGTLAEEYLINHRKIETNKINLSEDIRFIKQAYSSETNSYQPALLVIGRDKETNSIKSAQITYLDPKTQDKNKSLETKKRSFGSAKGSIVDLTANKRSKTIFIAEGVETALSIAQVAPDARVIATLGSSNLKYIDLGRNKNIVICADNDGIHKNNEPIASRIAVEQAAKELARRGNTLTVIMPDLASGQKKADFNDVLKIYGEKKLCQYVAPIITKGFDYKKTFAKLAKSIANKKYTILSSETKILSAYKHPNQAIQKLNLLLDTQNSKDVLHIIKFTPEVLGELDESKNKQHLIELLTKHARTLILNRKLLKTHQEKLHQLTKTIKQKIQLKLDTKDKNIQELEQALEKEVFHALKTTDNRCDFESVKKVSLKVAEQILHQRERFGKEPNTQQKLEFFLRARYELEREPKIKKQIAKMYPNKNVDDKMLLTEKLARASSIDSRLADKENIYYTHENFAQTKSILKQGDKDISLLKGSIEARGVECPVKAEFIAKEIVKHEERYGAHMPPSNRNTLSDVGNYVSHGHSMMLKHGFTHPEASRIMHKEGALLTLYHSKRVKQLQISEPAIKHVQQESKQFYMQSKTEINSPNHHSKQAAFEKVPISRSLEIGGR